MDNIDFKIRAYNEFEDIKNFTVAKFVMIEANKSLVLVWLIVAVGLLIALALLFFWQCSRKSSKPTRPSKFVEAELIDEKIKETEKKSDKDYQSL